MNSYTFVLNFTLPQREDKPEQYLSALFEAGCDDATIGVGAIGMIGLDFTRSADSAEGALRSAIRDVMRAIPGALLVQAGPDLVGLSDMAEIFGFTRQNMRKYVRGTFPAPTILGEPGLWHLAEIAAWLKLNTKIRPDQQVFEVSKVAAKINLEIGSERVGRILELA